MKPTDRSLTFLAGVLAATLATFGSVVGLRAADEDKKSTTRVDFARDIQPIFARRCYECHADKKQESNFRLDVKAIAMQGGDLGERAIVPGKSAESFLFKAVSDPRSDVTMPPRGGRLKPAEIQLIRQWIDQGANWPDELSGQATLSTNHWSFQPVVRRIPAAPASAWAANPIDSWVLLKLGDHGLTPSQPADRVSLIRRIYLDALGLPPSPEEVHEFVASQDPLAYQRLVDRVLASPRYGERWARHWLDIVRFAESHGFETNRERPNAWPYRDYVIAAFNSDKPYDQFIQEQLAGDALKADVATGFLVAGPHDLVKSPDANLTLMQRQDELADMVNTTGATFLGLTLGCARCHNHKFDPILQRDFYAMQAVFAGVTHAERRLPRTATPAARELAELKKQLSRLDDELHTIQDSLKLRPAVNARHNVERFPATTVKFIRFIAEKSSASEPCLDELEVFSVATQQKPAENVALASRGSRASASGVFRDGNHPLHQLKHINDGVYGNSKSWIAKVPAGDWVQIELAAPTKIDRIEWGRDRQGKYADRVAIQYRIDVASGAKAADSKEQPKLHWRTVASSADRLPFGVNSSQLLLEKLRGQKTPQAKRGLKVLQQRQGLLERIRSLESQPVIYAGTFSQPPATHRLYRGDPLQRREVVAPDTLTVMQSSLKLKVDAPEQVRRVALAKWISNEQNPLTARVMANRLWHYHFGSALVATPSDFGANGVRPSHPELLDWLAAELMGPPDWSLKQLQRLVMTSATYRQSSRPDPEGLKRDAGSRLLWRFPPRRLEAEAIRDSILSVCGSLDLRMGGPGFNVFNVQMENVRHYFQKESFGPAEWRRMVYMTKFRQEQDGIFGAFDCPDGSQTMPKRAISTSPLQAFNLLNSQFMLQQATILQERIKRRWPADSTAQARQAFWLVLARTPTRAEADSAKKLISEHGLQALCRALLNANEFLFIP